VILGVLITGTFEFEADLASKAGTPPSQCCFPVDGKLSNRAGVVPNDLQQVKTTGHATTARPFAEKSRPGRPGP